MAVDPSYPLYPLASTLASMSLLLVLLTSFSRRVCNRGVAFLCFWLFLENIATSASTIIWSNNADIKFYAYCDIVSHLQVICFIVKPMSTFIIMRRLHVIATLRSLEGPTQAQKRWDMVVEWTLGLFVPLLVAGPFYYIVQQYRFEVIEGFGCTNGFAETILTVLLIQSWGIVPPLFSVIFYYPKVVTSFYRQRRDVERFIASDYTVSRTNYLRILALASIDIFLTLPIGILNVVLGILLGLEHEFIPFYPGWTLMHNDFAPTSFAYADLAQAGNFTLAQTYFSYWTSPFLAFVIFGLFGLTPEARSSYRQIVRYLKSRLGRKSAPVKHDALEVELRAMEFSPADLGDESSLDDIAYRSNSGSLYFALPPQPHHSPVNKAESGRSVVRESVGFPLEESAARDVGRDREPLLNEREGTYMA